MRKPGSLCAVVLALPLVAAAAEPDRRVVEAAKARDVQVVRALVAAKADVRAAQGDGATALHWAAHWDDVDMARLLLAAGASAAAGDDHGTTPLSLACLNGSATMVHLLLDAGADANAASVAGETPLMGAARTGSVEAVRALLARGANVAAVEASLGQTALMRAVAENHEDVVRTLVEAGADVNARSKNRFTALLFAAQQGHVGIARLLLASGADVNDAAPDGIGGDTNAGRAFRPDTEAAALLVAIDSGHEPLAGFLLNNGADPRHSGAGRTALHSAVQQRMPALAKALLDTGADPNARLTRAMPVFSRLILQQHGLEVSVLGATPYWLAASYGDVVMLRLLATGGATPTLPANDGTTPLMVAAGVDFVEGQDKYGQRWFSHDTTPIQAAARAAVDLCLELGADVNASNNKGQTAIFGATYFRSPEMVRFLVERGAKVNVVNARGQTPWRVTQGEYRSGSYYADKPTGEYLVQAGADTTLGKDLGRESVSRQR